MKPLKVNFTIQPVIIGKMIGIIIILGLVSYSLIHYAINPIIDSWSQNENNYKQCNVTLDDISKNLTHSAEALTNCTAQKVQQFNDLNGNVSYFKDKYSVCISNLNAKSNSISELSEQLNECEDDLDSCESQRNSYKKQHEDCEDELDDCKAE